MADHRQRDEGADQELLEAIDAAARLVGEARPDAGPGSLEPAREPAPVVVRFDTSPPPRLRFWLLTLVLIGSAAGAAYLSLRPQDEPPAAEVEADLRWAVAQVVRRVEELRGRSGRLPLPGDLQGLVSDLVVYEPLADGYWVYGERGSVRVEFDGTVPLERWERLRTY